jgi:putative copper export protein
MVIVNIINSFLHVASIVAWIGGLIYQLFILTPALKKVEPNIAAQVLGATLKKFRILVVVCIVIMGITGIVNLLEIEGEGMAILSTYGIVLLLKHIITFPLIILGLVAGFYIFPKMEKLAIKNEEPNRVAKLRGNLMTIAIINTILGIILVLLATALPKLG